MVVYGGWARTVWNVIAVGPPYCNDWSCPIPPYSNGAQNYISRGGYIDGGYTFTHDFDGGADNGKHYARSAWVAFRRAGMVSCSLGGHWGPPCDDCQCCATTGITQVTIDGVSVPYPGCPYTAPQQYTITVNTSPSGLDSPYGGGTYNQGTWITIGVNNVGGYTFKQWNRDGAVYTYSQSFSYQVDAPHTFTAVFQPAQTQYYVCTYTNPSNVGGFYLGGQWYSNGQRAPIIADGRSYTLQAGSVSGYKFQSWSTVRSVYVANSYSASTTVSFNPSGWDGTCLGGLSVNYQQDMPTRALMFIPTTRQGTALASQCPYTKFFDIDGSWPGTASFTMTLPVGTWHTANALSSVNCGGITYSWMEWDRSGYTDPAYRMTTSTSWYGYVEPQGTWPPGASSFGDINYAVYQAQSVTITVNTSPAGFDSPYGGGSYAVGTWITIGVNNVNGYMFKQWNRDGAVYTYSQSFSYQVDASHTFTAVFQPQQQYTYTIYISGLGGSTRTNVYLDGNYQTYLYNSQSWSKQLTGTHTISVEQYAATGAPAGTRYYAPTYAITVSQAGSYTFQYHPQYQLTMVVNPSGAGSTSPPVGASWYDANYALTITTTPNTGYGFQYWQRDAAYYTNSQSFTYTLEAPHTFTAVFQQKPCITVNTSPAGLDSPYGGGCYDIGTWTTIGVNNVGGYTFKQWNRDGTVYTYSQSFSYQVDASHTFTAVFQPKVTVTVNTSPAGLDSPYGGGQFDIGQWTTIGVSSPVSYGGRNYIFKQWNRDGAVYTTSIVFNYQVDAAHTFTAVFQQEAPRLTSFVFNTIASPQTAGQAFTITVTAKDQYGATYTAYTGSNTLTAPGISPTTTGAFSNGVWSGSVTITVAGSTSITTSGGGATGTSNSFTVNPGLTVKIVLTAYPSTITAGSWSTVYTVQRHDQWGNPTTAGTTTVNLASTSTSGDKRFAVTQGGSSITSVTIANGASTASFYYYDTKTGTWTISVSGAGLTGDSKPLTVTPGALDHFTMTGYPTSTTSGVSFGANNVVLTAYDAYGNVKTDYRGAVWFTSTDPLATLPYTASSKYTFTAGDNGAHTFSGTGFVLNTVGTQTITATDGTKSITSSNITVNAGALDHFIFDRIDSPQTVGQAFTVKITAKDSAGQTVISYSGTNTLSDLTGSISPTSTGPFVNGVWQGAVTITKTRDDDTITTTGGGKQGVSNTFDVDVAAAGLDHFTFNSISSPQTAGVAFTVTVTAVDQYGNTVTSYTGTNSLTASTGSGTINPTSIGPFLNGVWSGSVAITKVQNGVTITTSGSGKTGTSNSFNVVVGALDHFVFDTVSSPQTMGQAFTITITAVDAAGNTVASYTGSNTLSDTTGTITSTATGSFTNGVWTGDIVINKAQNGVTITTSGSGKTGTSNSFDIARRAGGAFDFIVTASPTSEQVGKGDSIAVSITALLVRGTADAVSLSVSGVPAGMQATFDSQSGTPTFTTTLTITASTSTALGSYTLTVTGTGGGVTRTVMLDIEVTRTTPKGFTVRVYPAGAFVLQGASTTMMTTVNFRGGYSETVTLSYPNLPSGVGVSCTPNSGGSTFQASCTISTQASVNPSEYIIEVKGTGGDGKTRSAYFLLLIESAPPGGHPANPDYAITVNPTSLAAAIPTTGAWSSQLTTYIYSMTGFIQPVSLTVTGLPSGVTATFTPGTVTPPANGRESSSLKLTVTSTATPGTFKVTATGTAGSLSHVAEFILTLRPAPQQQTPGLYVKILQPVNGATVSGTFQLTANCTDLVYGPGNVNATYQLHSSTYTSSWMPMIPPKDGGSIWRASVDTVALQLENGDYTVTVKATRINDVTMSTTDSITVHLDNTGIIHRDTYLINYPLAASLHGNGDNYDPNWWFEEGHFMPGETMGVRVNTGSWAGRSDVKVTISVPQSLLYAPLLSKYPATQTISGPIPSYATAVFPFDFSKQVIYGQWQVTVEACVTGQPCQTIPLAYDGAFTIEGPTADWYTMQHLDHASVVAALEWPSTSTPVLHRTGTISVSSTVGASTQVSGIINDAGAVITWTPYLDWYGQPTFTANYAGSNVKVMRNANNPLEQKFTYDVLAVSYTIVGQDYEETAHLEFFARYRTEHPAVDAYVALQVSTDQPWLKAQTVGGSADVPITVTNPDGSKPLAWTVRLWTYAVKFTSPDGTPAIFANQWANLEVDHEDYTATVTVDAITRQTGGLSVDASVASSAMWLDMNTVEAKIVVKNNAGQVVGQQTYAVTLLHGKANHFTWLVNGNFTPGTYTVEVTLTYGILSPPATIGTATQQLVAN